VAEADDILREAAKEVRTDPYRGQTNDQQQKPIKR
jgi:hypothetical protein